MRETLLFTQAMADAMAEVEGAGGVVVHVLGSQALVVRLPQAAAACALRHASERVPEQLDDEVALLVAAWRASEAKRRAGGKSADDERPWTTPGREAP